MFVELEKKLVEVDRLAKTDICDESKRVVNFYTEGWLSRLSELGKSVANVQMFRQTSASKTGADDIYAPAPDARAGSSCQGNACSEFHHDAEAGAPTKLTCPVRCRFVWWPSRL